MHIEQIQHQDGNFIMYKLVYESDINLSYFDNIENTLGIILSVFVFIVLWKFNSNKKIKKFLVYIIILFSIITLYGISDFYITKNKIISALNNKSYKIVDGYVKNFHAMQKGGHDIEKFDVNKVHFEILYTGDKPNKKTLFYTLVKNEKGHIRKNMQKVKI